VEPLAIYADVLVGKKEGAPPAVFFLPPGAPAEKAGPAGLSDPVFIVVEERGERGKGRRIIIFFKTGGGGLLLCSARLEGKKKERGGT